MGRGKKPLAGRASDNVRTQIGDGDGRNRLVPVVGAGGKHYPPGTVLKKPQEWAADEGILIMDPDGWRRPGDPDFDAPTTYEDYYPRMQMSTLMPLNR